MSQPSRVQVIDIVQVVVGDIRNVADFAYDLRGIDIIFHTAAYFREYSRTSLLGVQRQAAAVRMFLRFFGIDVLPLDINKLYAES